MSEFGVMPKGWTVARLADLVDRLQYGLNAKAEAYAAGPRFLRITDLGRDGVAWAAVPGCQVEEGDLEKYRLFDGDIVFARSGSIEKAWRVQAPPDAVFASYLIRGRPIVAELSAWLGQFVRSPDYLQQIGAAGAGIALQNVNAKKLGAVDVPLPPVAEQGRIVAKLEELQARSRRAREALEAVPPLLERFRQSVLAAAFRGDLTADRREGTAKPQAHLGPPITSEEPPDEVPSGWSWRRLVDIARLESGHTPRKSVAEYWEGGDIPWISLRDIRAANGRVIRETESMPTMKGIENSSARLLPAGTVCFSRDISVGFVTIMGCEMATTQHFANWICGEEIVNRYLMFAFMAARPSLVRSGEGTTVRTIYMPALKRMQVRLPPVEEQREIVARIDAAFERVELISPSVAAASSRLGQLDSAVLAKAFRGELVPHGPSDEPADALLERVRAERESVPGPKRAGRRKRASG